MNKLLLHPRTKEHLNDVIKSPVHGLGIEGKSGSGKKRLARYIAAKALDVVNVEENPYIKIIDCSAKTGIDEIRAAIKFLSLKIPGDNAYKRGLIFYSFENLSGEAQNALLKSLEEPPKDTLIIITTEAKGALLPTTVSRLRWLRVLPVTKVSALDFYTPEHEEKRILNAYAISGGEAGMMDELLESYEEHPLVVSLKSAKEIIKMDKFERLARLDSLNKSPDFDAKLSVGLATVLRAAMISQVEKPERSAPTAS